MAHLIDKDALIAEIEKRRDKNARNKLNLAASFEDNYLLSFLDTLEVKEIHEDIDMDFDSFFEEFGVEPGSRFASMLKESFYKGIDRYLNNKENKL